MSFKHKQLDQRVQGYGCRCPKCKFSAFMSAESMYIFTHKNNIQTNKCPHCGSELMVSGLNEALVSEYTLAYICGEDTEWPEPEKLSPEDQQKLNDLLKDHKNFKIMKAEKNEG